MVPAGAHAAWLIHYIDLGTHLKKSVQYGDKDKRQGRLTFEIPGEQMADGRPMTIGKNITLSTHKNGEFRQAVSSWVSRAFTDDEFTDYDERGLFQIPCLINVIHGQGQDGAYAYVSSIQALPKGMGVDNPVNEYIYVSLDPEKFSAEELDKLPHLLPAKRAADYLALIQASPEWHEMSAQPEPDGAEEAPADDFDNSDAGDEGGFPDDENPAPPQARAPAPAQRAAPPAQRPAPAAPAARPAPAQAPQQRQAPAAAPRPAAPATPQRAAYQPAPSAPAPRPGGVAQRAAAPRPGPQQAARPAARPHPAPPLQQDIGDEVPY